MSEWSDTPSGIEPVRDIRSAETPAIYNLQGQRMQSTSKGINIVNGKKVMIK